MATITRQWVVDNIFQLVICWSKIFLHDDHLFYGVSETQIAENLLLRDYYDRMHFRFCPSPWVRDYFTGDRLLLKPAVRHLVDVGYSKNITVWIDPGQELLNMLNHDW